MSQKEIDACMVRLLDAGIRKACGAMSFGSHRDAYDTLFAMKARLDEYKKSRATELSKSLE